MIISPSESDMNIKVSNLSNEALSKDARCAGSTRNLGRGALHAPRAPPRIGAVRASSPAHASETSAVSIRA